MRRSLIVLSAALCSPAVAQDFPGYGGRAQSQTNAALIVWECIPASGNPMTCTLVETSIDHPPEKNVETEVAELLSERNLGNCEQMATIRLEMQAGIEAAFENGRIDDAQSAIFNEHLDALERICDEQSREAVSAFVDLQNEIGSRTCRVATSLRKVEFDWNPTSSRWESVTPPYGSCGVIDITAMEKADELFWNLRRQILATNRTGTDELGETCTSIEDRNETYEWTTRGLHLGCQFVEFGR